MNAKELGVNFERRSTKTLIRWYGILLRYGWVKEFGEKPAERDYRLWISPMNSIQTELGRRVLRDAKWGRE